jgi:hypothetical protein
MSVSVGELIRANGIQKGVRTVFTDKGRTRGRANRVCLVGAVCTTEALHRVIVARERPKAETTERKCSVVHGLRGSRCCTTHSSCSTRYAIWGAPDQWPTKGRTRGRASRACFFGTGDGTIESRRTWSVRRRHRTDRAQHWKRQRLQNESVL